MTPRVVSTNVAVRREDPSGRHDYTGIDKQPRELIDVVKPGPNYGDGSGVVADSIGDQKHHGGADKAIYAFAREELDWWEDQLGRSLPSGSFGENLTTEGIVWKDVLINQRLRIGSTLLEVSVPRQPCATFSGWIGERGWLKTFTQHGEAGAYLRVIEPGQINTGEKIELLDAPAHDITMGMAFAAKMGDKELARRVVEANVLPAIHHEKLVKIVD